MGSISKKEIEEYLDKVLHEDRPLVIAIKGKWGVGKIFFIKEFLENKFKNKCVYTSLFGKNDVREVIQEIILNLYSRNQLINKIKRLLGLTSGTASYQTDINKDVSFNLSIGTSLFYSLLEFWETEIMTENLQNSIKRNLESFQKEIQNEAKLREKSYYINNIYKNYLLNLNYTKTNFTNNTWKFLEENKDNLLNLTSIWNVIFLLKKLIKSDSQNRNKYLNFAEEIFTYYLKSRISSNIEFLFDQYSEIYSIIEEFSKLGLNKVSLEKKFDEIKSEYKKQIQNLDCERLLKYLQILIKKNGWSNSKLETINSIGKDKLKRCFIEAGDLSLIRDFHNYYGIIPDSNSDSNHDFFKNFRENLLKVLEELRNIKEYEEKISELQEFLKIQSL